MSALPERFAVKYVPEPMSGCWIWIGACNSSGYGSFHEGKGRRLVGAHRFAFEFIVGPVPAGLELDHLCRTRACVNPAHLEPVPHRENMRRSPIMGESWRAKSRQTHCIHGHEFNDANTIIAANGTRHCRVCDRVRHRRYRLEKQAA